MELLTAAFILASLSPLAHAGVIGLREAPTNNSSLPYCPDVDGDIPVFHPHPTNCSLYYMCWQGHPYLYSCPAGLYWDQGLSTCNWPSQVQCHPIETLPFHSSLSSLIEDPSDNSSLPSCPDVDGDIPVFHPHPTNCSLYYMCWKGHPYLYSCPAGLYWDQGLTSCNWPSQVECHLNYSTEEAATEESLIEKTTAEEGTKTRALENPFFPSCPSSADPVYFPHPQNCSLFYECSNGIPYLFSCPDGLYFDPTLNVCNFPSQVTCNASNETTEKPTEEPSRPTQEPSKPTEEPSKPTEEPSKPTEEPSKPTEEPSKPTEEPSKPTEEPSKPTEEPSKPTEEPSKPTEEPSKPTEEPSNPTEEPSKPTEEPSKPTEEPSKPTEEPSKPTEEHSNSTKEPSKPTEEPSKPTEEPSKPTEEPSKPTDEPIDEEGSGLL